MNKPDLIRKIKLILKHDNIEKQENAGAKQGLEKALEILESNQRDLSGLDELDTTQAKAIAKFAIDFNNMKHNGEFFIALGESIEGKVPDEKFYKKLWKIMEDYGRTNEKLTIMATNNSHQDIIKAYLDKRAQEDALFAVTYAKENKNLKDCYSYITSQAKKQASNGCAMIEDDVVFGWAVHDYDEDDIKVEKTSNMRVSVNNSAPKTEEKKEAPKAKIKPKKQEDVAQLSLF